MTKALDTFNKGLKDTENILAIYDIINQNGDKMKELFPSEVPNVDILKRACVVMAFTAFETFFENLVKEVNSKQIVDCSDEKKRKQLERFHNPTSKNIIELYKSWFGIDNCLSEIYFDGRNTGDICNQLDEYLKIRGQVVHLQKTETSNKDEANKNKVVKILGFLHKFAEAFNDYIEEGKWISEVRNTKGKNV